MPEFWIMNNKYWNFAKYIKIPELSDIPQKYRDFGKYTKNTGILLNILKILVYW